MILHPTRYGPSRQSGYGGGLTALIGEARRRKRRSVRSDLSPLPVVSFLCFYSGPPGHVQLSPSNSHDHAYVLSQKIHGRKCKKKMCVAS